MAYEDPHLDGQRLPLNLGLNDGTYMPEACIEVLKRYLHRTSLRNYSTANNDPLRQAIATLDGVKMENVFLHNGSGPILKQVMPKIIEDAIRSSYRRIVKHVVSKNGFPIITPQFTYCKVPKKASTSGLTWHMIPTGPEDNFTLPIPALEEKLRKQDGMVYIVNPNNPTGNVQILRHQLIPLLERFPRSRFWIDEAYVQYVDPAVHTPLSDLVTKYPHLVVSRTFSFAYGLAAARIGYLLAQPSLISNLEKQITDYRIGGLQEDLAIAALQDPDHLPFLRAMSAKERHFLTEGLEKLPGVKVFPSQTNFLFCSFTDGRSGEDLRKKVEAKGILIKSFEPIGPYRYDPYFRLTLGTPEENQLLLQVLTEVIGG